MNHRQWDNDYVWHPFTPMSDYREEAAPIIERGEGFYLFDTDGEKYLDGISSLWCNVHGHRVPEIDQAIRDQLDRVAHTTLLGLSSVPSIELARELVERTPEGLNKVFFSDSGATSVEAALKIVYQYHRQKTKPEPDRNLFVCLGDAYHGDTVGSVSVGGMELFHGVYRNLLFPTLTLPAPVPFLTPSELSPVAYLAWCFDEVETLIEKNHERIAGVIMEPLVQGAAGIWVHARGYLKHVREVTARFGIPLIADEVAVGFGRTGTMFACEQEDVRPDVMCLAKGLTGGYLPVAATLATDEIANAFHGEPHEGKTFFHGHTFTGNPLGCAAALATLKLFDDRNTLENVQQIADTLKAKLAPLANHPHVWEVRQKGTMVGIQLIEDRETKQRYSAESRIGHQVTLAARKQGVILRPLGDVIVLMPAPAMPVALVEHLCEATIDAISKVTQSE